MIGEWPTANVALVISGCSFALALASFVWNIWSKFIFPKPRLAVDIAFVIAVGGARSAPNAISLTAVNHGPGDLAVHTVVGKLKASSAAPGTRALLGVYTGYPHSLAVTAPGQTPGLPCKLSAGESTTVYLPEDRQTFRSFRSFGFVDGYGREHFASRRSEKSFQNFLRGKG